MPKKRMLVIISIRHALVFLLLLVVSTGSLFAGTPAEDDGCFLWEVQSETGLAYLLGSLHLGTVELFPLNPKIEEAYEKSSILVLEVNVLAVDEQKLAGFIQQNAVNPDFTGIDQFLTEDKYTMLVNKLQEFNIEIEKVAMYRPWFLATLISMMEMIKRGFNPDLGLDQYFARKAVDEKDILELETAEAQITMLTDLPPDLECLYLVDILTSDDSEELFLLVEAWKTGDTGIIEEILFSGLTEKNEYYRLYEKIYFQRNREMAAKIEEYLQVPEIYFIVVGVGHLVGEEGIVELLSDRGYKIRKL